jgi:hypothetical protein
VEYSNFTNALFVALCNYLVAMFQSEYPSYYDATACTVRLSILCARTRRLSTRVFHFSFLIRRIVLPSLHIFPYVQLQVQGFRTCFDLSRI